MTERIRILIADDHPIVRDGLAAVLATQPDFDVVGAATNGEELVNLARTLQPAVALVDLEMPRADGVQAIERLRVVAPQTYAVVLTAFDTDERILSAIKAGARGYLLKGAPRADIFNAIRVVSAGGSLLQPPVAARVLAHLSAPTAPPPPALTPREQEVLDLLAAGQSNKQIAAALIISERTVKFHVSAILAKLGAANRTEAAAYAHSQHGAVPKTPNKNR